MERRQMLKSLLTGSCSVLLGSRVLAQSSEPAPYKLPDGARQRPVQPAGQVQLGQGQGQGAPRPQANPVVVVPKKLEEALADWERKTARIERLHGTHQRYVYDNVFRVEKRAVGEFWYEAPDKGRIDFRPGAVPEDGKNPLKPGFTVQAAEPETWVCTGEMVLQIHLDDKSYAQFEIPPNQRGESIAEGPLPFLFGMTAQRLKARYRAINLGDMHDPTGARGQALLKEGKGGWSRPQYHVVVYPGTARDAENWQRAEVILDAEFCLPTAIRLLDPAGTTETVYVFPLREMRANESNWLEKFRRSPFEPSLRGFKVTQQQTADPQQPIIPAGNREAER